MGVCDAGMVVERARIRSWHRPGYVAGEYPDMKYKAGLGGPSFVGVDIARQLRRCARLATHIEFENTWNHDDGVRTISVLEHCKTEGLGTIDEESAPEAALVPNNPVLSTVLANEQERSSRTRRRFGWFHAIFLDVTGIRSAEIVATDRIT
jgi:hypothetical protein